VHTLMDTPTGVFTVTTESSTYVVDLDLMIVTRIPGVHDREVATMRHDGQPMRLLGLDDCTVGRSLIMFVDLRIPGIPWTLRASTPVHLIEAMAARAVVAGDRQ
jgi:hypothetical protein